LAPKLRWFISLCSPDCILLLVFGVMVGRIYGKRCYCLLPAMVVSFMLMSDFYRVNTLRMALSGFLSNDVVYGLTFTVFSLLTYGALFVGGWIGASWRKRGMRPAGHCVTCGYSLVGLMDKRCPECGKPF
jgi:hypothetical protein